MIDVATETVISLTEAARRLGKHRDTLRAWVRKGLLEAVDLAGRLHTSVEALRRLARQRGAEELPPSPREREQAEARTLEVLKRWKVI